MNVAWWQCPTADRLAGSESTNVTSKLGMTHRGDGIDDGVPYSRYAITRDEFHLSSDGGTNHT